MKKTFLKFLLIVPILFFCVPSARAADFLFDHNAITLNQNDEVKINFFVDSDSKKINAISGKLKIPNNILVKDIYYGESGINFWIEKPYLEDDYLIFSGIVPNGFFGKINIFSIIIKANELDQNEIILTDARALINDGLGTDDMVNYSSISVMVEPAIRDQEPIIVDYIDKEPPIFLMAEIIQDKSIFDNKKAIIFFAEDKQSGVDRYEILEQKQYRFLGIKYCSGKWKKAQSPHLLSDQKLKSHIYLKAIDKLKNEQTMTLQPLNPIKWYENIIFWGIILTALICGAIFCVYVKKRIDKK